ncbi:HoxN/HupN/NixA family nickel/cobalt transporter [Nocardia huaxiensis]|uniref:Nickel/cobalt efflux system n=1 Tax=Nocardia huaxiensis TaxID=2755382 RepID=A0A7D6Z666_9NOCA|nr:HoxN/HupN/NixA family nickel/cobalt transporter [Nocardia huaxiensis]QLY34066.1 HoxN/HupN/NixA family nickel/cobalt transporter [Nocardia huaxiensis]UFT00196.1 HoxN/HupN/NixA family nickel/cobalt transporter [Nocardia huaxiensis]
MGLAVLALHILGWGTLLFLVVPGHYEVQGAVFGVGLGVTAYTLGMRHAFDADHIAAIDNTTRKLVAENGRAKTHTVGFWFALGHSTIVFVMVGLLALGVRALAGPLEDEGSALHTWTGLWGTSVSGTFLIAIGLLNLVSLIGIWRVFKRMRGGDLDEERLERELNDRGLLNRILGPVVRLVRKPWQMYPVGVLFGLGFDTVTEVGLLVIAGGAAATGLPWYSILVLPVLFSAGMALFDSLDGSFMSYAYDWAFARPVRKIYYNLVVTGLSVTVALLIGVQEIVSIFVEKLGITSGFVGWVGSLDLGDLGFIIVGLFILTWAVAVAVWRLTDMEARWEKDLAAD